MTQVQDSTEAVSIGGVEYRVLGPLSAHVEGKPRKLGGRRQRTVLAVLLSRPNTVITQDTLIDTVWAGLPPETSRQTLHTYVSTLRKALGGEIERDGDGYVLRVERNRLDALHFEDLIAEARKFVDTSPAKGLALLQEALGLWHGPAFGDLGGEPALTNEVVRLEESRLLALELRIEADLALGNHAAVVQELEALTREHPYRERLRGLLMLALYRSGRQADALRAYQQTRLFLAEELGIDPSPEIQALEEQILSQDPALDWQPINGGSSEVDRAARGYELREKVRETPVGVTYRGFQSSVGREVAVLAVTKSIANDPAFVRRFESEMQSVSQLEHPHIVPVFDFWRDPDGAYLVTAYLRGGSLRDSLDNGPWNLSTTSRLVDQVSSALAHAHRNGFVHGSLGLDNVGLDDDANAYVGDLGISDLVSPESGGDPSPAGDVYDLAVIAFTVLAGEPPRDGHRISESRSDLVELDDFFLRALHPDSESRYQKPEDLRRALLQAAGTDVVAATAGTPTTTQKRNPYKGLRAFHEPDAADFHGRDALIEETLEALAASRLVTVVGPSGSGKSSLVRAGLVPALRSGDIEGSRTWLITEMFPGTHPFEEMEAALMRVAVDRPSGLIDELISDERGLARVAKLVLPTAEDELVLVIDQFEELFSLVSSESNRRLFLDSLAASATDERSRVRIVLTLRADFFDQPLEYPDFGEVMRDSLVAVSPPTEDGLARAIAQPARDVGVDLEPGLVTRIVDDVREEPGGLPLMQYALTELFARQENNTLTLAAYNQTGGVLGALGNRAEEIYKDLSDEGKEAARQLFLRLVTVDELADDTRRRVRQTELRGLGLSQSILDDVVQQFGAFRLLSFDRDAATRTPTIEVAHEALIREWDRLRTWIDERREDLLIHRRIQMTALDWEDSGKDPSYLLRGSRLEQALIWQERTDIAISEDEMTLIEASIEQEKREDAERQALEDKAARRRKAVIGVLAGGLVVAGLLGAVAVNRAQAERVAAAKATAGELSAAAILAVQEDPELGILLALEAISATEELGLEPIPEAASAIRDTLRQQRIVGRLPNAYAAIAYNIDGGAIVTNDPDPGVIHLWDSGSAEELAVWQRADVPSMSPGEINAFKFSPTGELVAATWIDPEAPNASGLVEFDPSAGDDMVAVSLHDAATLQHRQSLIGERGEYFGPTFGSNGLVAAFFLSLSNQGMAYVWDLKTEKRVLIVESETDITGAEFIPGTDILVVSHRIGMNDDGTDIPARVIAIDVSTDEELWSLVTPELDPFAMTISPDGSKVAVGDLDGRRIQVWDVVTQENLLDTSHGNPQILTWSPDSSRLAVSGNDSDITVFAEDEGAWELFLTLTGHKASVWGTEFHPGGEFLASASLDGSGLIWDVTNPGAVGDQAVDVGGDVGQFFLGPDPDRMIVGVTGPGAQTMDIASGSVEASLSLPNPFHFKPNDQLTAVAGTDDVGRGVLVNGRTGQVIQPLPECLTPMAVSSDERLVVLDSLTLCGDQAGLAASQLLDLTTNETLIDLGQRRLFKAFFSPRGTFDDNEYVVVNVAYAAIEIYSLDDFALVASYSAEELDVPAFLTLDIDPEGRYLGLGNVGSRAVVLDMVALLSGASKMDAVVLNLEGHTTAVPQVRVTSDGIAVSAGFDGFYRVWDTSTDEKLFEIRVPGLVGQGAARFTWDGTQMAYEDDLGNIRFTPLDINAVIVQAEAALTRTLTDDECRQYLHTEGCQ